VQKCVKPRKSKVDASQRHHLHVLSTDWPPPYSTFGPSPAWCCRLLRPLLTSAAPSRRLAMPVAHRCREQDRPPRVSRVTFVPSTGRIYSRTLRVISGFGNLGSRPGGRLLCACCSPGRYFGYSFLQTPPRHAIAVRLTVPIVRIRRGLSPPRHQSDTTSPVKALRAMPGAPRRKGTNKVGARTLDDD
jgi:hypothetical protein